MNKEIKQYDDFFVYMGCPVTSDAVKILHRTILLKPYIEKAYEKIVKKPLIQIKKLTKAIQRPDIKQREYKILTSGGTLTYNADELKRIPDELADQIAILEYFNKYPELIASDIVFLLHIDRDSGDLEQILFQDELKIFQYRYPGGLLDLLAAEVKRLYDTEHITAKPNKQRDSLLNQIADGKGRRTQTTEQDDIRAIRETNPEFEGKGGEYHNERTGATIALQYTDKKPHKMTAGFKMHLDIFAQLISMTQIYDYTRPVMIRIKYSDLARLRNSTNTTQVREELLKVIDLLWATQFVISTTDGTGDKKIARKAILTTTETVEKYDREIEISFSPDFLQALGIEDADEMRRHIRRSVNDELYQIPQQYITAYLIGQYLTSRFYADNGKESHVISTKTLLNHVSSIPKPEDIPGNRTSRYIVQRLVNGLSYLANGKNFRSGKPFLCEFEFTNNNGEVNPERLKEPGILTYNELIKTQLKFDITRITAAALKSGDDPVL